jgi:hypothetical protein
MTNSIGALKDLPAVAQAARLWRSLKERFSPAPIDTVDSLRTFLEERAALIAQKCAIDYCRGKTGLASYALFTEKPFLDALDVCRWETFATVLGDLLIIAEGNLRHHITEAQQARLCEALVRLHSAVLTSMPTPAHRAQGWSDAIASFSQRIKSASGKEPRQALDVADHSAKRLFETLPIHLSMRALDEEVVYGAVRFRMIAVSQEMQRRVAVAELAAQLVAAS